MSLRRFFLRNSELALKKYFSLIRAFDNRFFRGARFESWENESKFALKRNAMNEYFILLTSDKSISKTIYKQGTYDFEKMMQVISLLGKDFHPNTLIDIGANIGSICIPSVNRGLFAEAIAIEPEPLNFSVLTANIWLNGLSDRIHTHNIALGAQSNQSLLFELSSNNSGDHRIRTTDEAGLFAESDRKVISVKSERLDSIVKSTDPMSQLIWMDTQGYEGFVLQGATEKTSARVPMVIEFWPYGMKRAKSYPPLKDTVLNYSFFYDLSEKIPVRTEMSGKALDSLFNRLGAGGSYHYTDLLLI